MASGFVVPSKGAGVRNDVKFNNLKTKQSTNVPIYPGGNLPAPTSSNARQGDLAFAQSTTPGLEKATGALNVFDGTAWLGTVSGPAFATNNAVARYDGTTGKLIKNSLVIIDDSGNLSTPGIITAANLTGTNTGNVTLAAVDSNGTPNANAATLSGTTGQVLNLNSASSSQPGVVNTTTQAFLGAKTFNTTFGLPNTTGATAGVFTFGGQPFLHNFNSGNNIFMGFNSGNFTMGTTAIGNIGIGNNTLSSLTGGAGASLNNIAIGGSACNQVTTGYGNIGVGLRAIQGVTTGIFNIGIGNAALQAATTTANNNIGIGVYALNTLTTGTQNIAIGSSAGGSIPPAANNTILINNSGAGAADGSIYIGTPGTHTTTLMTGIQGVTPGGTGPYQVIVNSNGQLGSSSVIGAGVNVIGTPPQAATAPNNGAHLTITATSTTLFLEEADATHNGIVSAADQSFGGYKTFTTNLAVSNTQANYPPAPPIDPPSQTDALYYVDRLVMSMTWVNTSGTGPFGGTSGPWPMEVHRINSVVFASFGSVLETGSNVAGTIITSGALPLFAQPQTANRVYAIPVVDNGANVWGNMEVFIFGDPNAGKVMVSKGLTPGGTFSGVGQTGFNLTQIFYRVE